MILFVHEATLVAFSIANFLSFFSLLKNMYKKSSRCNCVEELKVDYPDLYFLKKQTEMVTRTAATTEEADRRMISHGVDILDTSPSPRP